MGEEAEKGRFERLGFRPQKENVYNKHLPYAESLDEESSVLFLDIKKNLIKSVLAREIRPGCSVCTSRLNRYIKVYGYKFSKEDHIALIKLYYELVTIPNLEPTRINKFAATLTVLLKKRYLISRDELQLDWKPLYELCMRTTEKNKPGMGMYRYMASFVSSLFHMIKACRIYFPASVTQEMLDQFLPNICPVHTLGMANATQQLEMFLPICVDPSEADISYRLWLQPLLELFTVCRMEGSWENHMMWLMARLGSLNMGYIDWEPHVATMFSRFIQELQLPVFYKQRQVGKSNHVDIFPMALWIVSALNGDNNSVFAQFEKFMQTLESYFHQANSGRWTSKLRDLLRKLSYCFVQRVHFERYKTPIWEMHIVDSFRLTDADIDRFVNIMKPCIEQAMFSMGGLQETSLTLQYLATLRPNIIVPITLDKLYAAMDSLTEPHKLISSMMGVIAVSRYMVQGKTNNYPEGPTHVIPLLMALLPGIDPNDMRKTYITFTFIRNFVQMTPIVDSSDAHLFYNDLTEEEHQICEATANFEDFVVQFFDRLCTWMESSSVDFVRQEVANNSTNSKSRSETVAEDSSRSVITVVLGQCSPQIFTVALRKIFNFVRTKVLETHLSGPMLAQACHCFARINPAETLRLFVPYLCTRIEELLAENPNAQKDEHVDEELLFNLLILSELCDGTRELLVYLNQITAIVDKTLHMTCIKASNFAARMLEVIMQSLTCIKQMDIKSTQSDYGLPTKDYLPIREWGKAYDLKDLKINWYLPGEREIDAAKTLLHRYLIPELTRIDDHISDAVPMSRQELKTCLKIVISLLSCHHVLPMWEEETIQFEETNVKLLPFNPKGNPWTISLPDGRNVRKAVADTLHRLQRKILECDESDTQSIKNLIQVYNVLLFSKSAGRDFSTMWDMFQVVKVMLEDRLVQKKMHLRHVLLDRVCLHQELRKESRTCSFTNTHKQIFFDMFELGISRYSDVRVRAQSKVYSIVANFPQCYTLLKDKILAVLSSDSETNHEAFKGCLYILVAPNIISIVARHDWDFIKDLWPSILKSKPSEKLTIINLMNTVSDNVVKHFPTITIDLVIPDRCGKAAYALANAQPVCAIEKEFQSVIDGSVKALEMTSLHRRKTYDTLVDRLLDACETGNLHWRHYAMALKFLRDLVHIDVKYSPRAVRFFLRSSISETLDVRKIALRVLTWICVQNKPRFSKVSVDPYSIAGVERPPNRPRPGHRTDNAWVLYDSQNLPRTAAQWDDAHFLHGTNNGYYAWSKEIKLYAPYAQQETAAKRMDKLTETEREIYAFFSDEENVGRLVKYMAMEEKKGSDQFNGNHYLVYKNLFKIFEDKLLDIFLPHIRTLVEDKQESSHRCAAELISGIIRGSKHWSYAQSERLWQSLLPLLDTVFSNISSEVLSDWSICFSMAVEWRDPRHYHWLIEHLMRDPLSEQTSFIASARLQILAIVVGQQNWRNAEVFARLLDYLRPHLMHPFQNIRQNISALIGTVLSVDVVFPGAEPNKGPKIRDFFASVMPQLNKLYCQLVHSYVGGGTKNGGGATKEVKEANCDKLELLDIGTDEDREAAIRLFKIVSRYSMISIVGLYCPTLPQHFGLIPLATMLQSSVNVDEELALNSIHLCMGLSQAVTQPQHIPSALDSIESAARGPFWSARAAVIEMLSVFVFYNMPAFHARAEWIERVRTLVLELLADEKPEVRESAAKVLSGLLHCQFLPDAAGLLDKFKAKARIRIKRDDARWLRTRHAGVLGMCAFINAHPYDVPDFLPSVFACLGPHLSDPQPIPATIRKTLGDFKRTHHNNWELHKLKFTEDELSVFADLTVPPSYYA